MTSKGGTRPSCIANACLFDAAQRRTDQLARGTKSAVASSVRAALWAAAEIYPQPSPPNPASHIGAGVGLRHLHSESGTAMAMSASTPRPSSDISNLIKARNCCVCPRVKSAHPEVVQQRPKTLPERIARVSADRCRKSHLRSCQGDSDLPDVTGVDGGADVVGDLVGVTRD